MAKKKGRRKGKKSGEFARARARVREMLTFQEPSYNAVNVQFVGFSHLTTGVVRTFGSGSDALGKDARSGSDLGGNCGFEHEKITRGRGSSQPKRFLAMADAQRPTPRFSGFEVRVCRLARAKTEGCRQLALRSGEEENGGKF